MCVYCYPSAAHCEVLQTVNSLYLASTLSQLQQTSQAGQSWGALKEPLLRECATVLLTHIVKVLCVYVHIIEERDPEAREKVALCSWPLPYIHEWNITILFITAEVAHACNISTEGTRWFAISRKTETSDPGVIAKIFSCSKVIQTAHLKTYKKSSFNDCRDGLGQFAHLPHYMKIYDASKAAYSNYKVS